MLVLLFSDINMVRGQKNVFFYKYVTSGQVSYTFTAEKSKVRFIGSSVSILISSRQINKCLQVWPQLFCAAWCLSVFPSEKPVQCCLRLPLDPSGLIQGGISLQEHKLLLFLQSWFLVVAIEATRGLKSCRADWEIGHVICPWNIMWHNMTTGHLYVKVNISAWQLDMSGQEQKRADKAPVSVVLYLRLRKRCCGSAWLPSV